MHLNPALSGAQITRLPRQRQKTELLIYVGAWIARDIGINYILSECVHTSHKLLRSPCSLEALLFKTQVWKKHPYVNQRGYLCPCTHTPVTHKICLIRNRIIEQGQPFWCLQQFLLFLTALFGILNASNRTVWLTEKYFIKIPIPKG